MKIKQKAIITATLLGFFVGIISAGYVTLFTSDMARAQSTDPCSVATGPVTSTACNEAVENNGDPCAAIRKALVDDGNTDTAERKWKECKKIAVCNTTATGPVTREACENAIDDDKNPCEAMRLELAGDPRNEGTTLADDTLAACEGAGGANSAEPLPEDKCDPSKNTCCGKVKTSIITGDFCDSSDGSSLEKSPIYGLLKLILKIMTAGIGVAAVGGITYGAILYSSAENKPEQTKKAIGIITNVVIGLVAYAMMFVLLNFLIPGGILE